MDDGRNTIRELGQAAAIGAVAFPAILAVLVVLSPIGLDAFTGLSPNAALVAVLFTLVAALHGAVLGFALGLAHLGEQRPVARRPEPDPRNGRH